MSANNPRSTRRYLACLKELKNRGEAQACWRCGKTLYAEAPRGHPLSITLGHIIALEDGGDPYDPHNYDAECMHCNYSDGARRTNRNRARQQTTPTTNEPTTSYRNNRWTKPQTF